MLDSSPQRIDVKIRMTMLCSGLRATVINGKPSDVPTGDANEGMAQITDAETGSSGQPVISARVFCAARFKATTKHNTLLIIHRVPRLAYAPPDFLIVTTSVVDFLFIAAAIVLPMVSAALRSGSASKCAYFAVMAVEECPSNRPMIGKPNAAPAPMLAKEWRRS